MKAETYSKRWVKLKRAVSLVNDEAERRGAALVVVRGACQRLCGRCGEGQYPVDIAIRAMKESGATRDE